MNGVGIFCFAGPLVVCDQRRYVSLQGRVMPQRRHAPARRADIMFNHINQLKSSTVGLFTCLFALGGCAQKPSKTAGSGATYRETEITLEECDIESKHAEGHDADGDGRPEVIQVYEDDSEICRAVDLNLDGKVDRTSFYDEAGVVRRVESDFDRDGRVDEVMLFEAGVLVQKSRATTMDGRFGHLGVLRRRQTRQDRKR